MNLAEIRKRHADHPRYAQDATWDEVEFLLAKIDELSNSLTERTPAFEAGLLAGYRYVHKLLGDESRGDIEQHVEDFRKAAVMEVADQWTQGQWVDVILDNRKSGQISLAQAFGDWIRARITWCHECQNSDHSHCKDSRICPCARKGHLE
jgi:hypothetical protein